ncbi:MAG: ATP-binding protein [Bacilli bacterium]|nr:ATP-binding protein [Bacilli bacterium]
MMYLGNYNLYGNSSNPKKKIRQGIGVKKTSRNSAPPMRRNPNQEKEDEKEILPRKSNTQKKAKSNPFGFDYSKVSEEEIIRGAIESDVSVFLHGKSSDGKSARVKEIDPDCIVLYMTNATPESLNGISVYNSDTNESLNIKPAWLNKIETLCEKEPDKLHIIFFDELNNTTPVIQGLAFNIILDHEVNGIWKLPKNARVVAAGNEVEDSLAANELVAPMFNRFAHVYINTDSDNWLKWAVESDSELEKLPFEEIVQPHKIHPAIASFIAYRSMRQKDALRTEYNGKTPNADPRKWEMASKILYRTGKVEMLRSLVGQELTRDFVSFCRNYDDEVWANVQEKYKNLNIDSDKVNHYYDKENHTKRKSL